MSANACKACYVRVFLGFVKDSLPLRTSINFTMLGEVDCGPHFKKTQAHFEAKPVIQFICSTVRCVFDKYSDSDLPVIRSSVYASETVAYPGFQNIVELSLLQAHYNVFKVCTRVHNPTPILPRTSGAEESIVSRELPPPTQSSLV